MHNMWKLLEETEDDLVPPLSLEPEDFEWEEEEEFEDLFFTYWNPSWSKDSFGVVFKKVGRFSVSSLDPFGFHIFSGRWINLVEFFGGWEE